jgi:hypothetical protein
MRKSYITIKAIEPDIVECTDQSGNDVVLSTDMLKGVTYTEGTVLAVLISTT